MLSFYESHKFGRMITTKNVKHTSNLIGTLCQVTFRPIVVICAKQQKKNPDELITIFDTVVIKASSPPLSQRPTTVAYNSMKITKPNENYKSTNMTIESITERLIFIHIIVILYWLWKPIDYHQYDYAWNHIVSWRSGRQWKREKRKVCGMAVEKKNYTQIVPIAYLCRGYE